LIAWRSEIVPDRRSKHKIPEQLLSRQSLEISTHHVFRQPPFSRSDKIRNWLRSPFFRVCQNVCSSHMDTNDAFGLQSVAAKTVDLVKNICTWGREGIDQLFHIRIVVYRPE
jgi:hypothetical protein